LGYAQDRERLSKRADFAAKKANSGPGDNHFLGERVPTTRKFSLTRSTALKAGSQFDENLSDFPLTVAATRLLCIFRYHADSGVPGVFFSSGS
jgi:hypothetical protein